ncbi:MAG TPA: tyrosine-type recombinase/integrase, partial [Candidatus Dormibacteraeota bacterium]|nr:tyrosine-type recombinase/integrase [Candidatus Dormibacteraeota bacterium]
GRFYEGSPKTESSDRWISVPRETMHAFEVHRDRMEREGHDVRRGRVFVTATGAPPNGTQLISDTLAPALKKAKLPKITWHALRHSFASVSIERGAPLEAVSRMLGHAHPGITARIYDKAFRARETIVADAWNVDDGATKTTGAKNRKTGGDLSGKTTKRKEQERRARAQRPVI